MHDSVTRKALACRGCFTGGFRGEGCKYSLLSQIRHRQRSCFYCLRVRERREHVSVTSKTSRHKDGAKQRKVKANTVYVSTQNYIQSVQKRVLFITNNIHDYMNISFFFSLRVSYRTPIIFIYVRNVLIYT
jgi:hypothetical protein